jgi:hypothetical protein
MMKVPVALLLSIGLTAPAFAGAVSLIDGAPWDPARMPVTVDQSQLQRCWLPTTCNS